LAAVAIRGSAVLAHPDLSMHGISTPDELGSADRFEPTAAHRCRPIDYSIFSLG
jgi:hypothetical protein